MRSVSGALAVVLSLLPLVPMMTGQCPAPSWSSLNQYSGPDGAAEATVTWDPDGAGPLAAVFVAGGTFPAAGRVLAANVAAWDGATWQPLGAGLDGRVRALAVFNGSLVAAGDFTGSGGAPVANIARWDGAVWQPLGTGMSNAGPSATTPSTVAALAVFNGELIAGGQFTTAGGVAASNIARWNGAAWQGVSGGISGAGARVEALTVWAGALHAGGVFTTAGTTAASRIARWTGASWQPLGAGITSPLAYAGVKCLAVFGGALVCGGTFTAAGGLPVNHAARWDGSAWQALGGGFFSFSLGGYASVEELAVQGGVLVAGGAFDVAGGVAARSIARWDGVAWQPLGVVEESVTSVAVHGPDLLVNARRRWDGTAWTAMEPGWLTGTNAAVNAVVSFRGELIAGGRFSVSGTAGPANVARFDGTSWHRLGSGIPGGTSASYAEVNALAVHNGDLIVAGQFLQAGGITVNHVARWDGSAWSALGGGSPGFDSVAVALAVYNGDLIAGGGFQFAGGVMVNRIAR